MPFKFELSDKRQHRSKTLGLTLLALAIFSGSLLGLSLNSLTPKGVFLKNAWRLQALALLMLVTSPFYCFHKPKQAPLLKKKLNSEEQPNSFRSYEEKYPRLSEVQESE